MSDPFGRPKLGAAGHRIGGDFIRAGADDKDLQIVRVPGAFEVPQTAKRLVDSGKYSAVICLGAVIRGSTPHFEYIAAESANNGSEGGAVATMMLLGIPGSVTTALPRTPIFRERPM